MSCHVEMTISLSLFSLSVSASTNTIVIIPPERKNTNAVPTCLRGSHASGGYSKGLLP
ncbi:hypothetical protein FVEN_g13144 [Fusarium venenatum]|nr:hypothetical protein FVEN_g13144 [Fusarium venenatum]